MINGNASVKPTDPAVGLLLTDMPTQGNSIRSTDQSPIINQGGGTQYTNEFGKIRWWQALIAGVVATLVPPFGAVVGAALTAYWSKGAGDLLSIDERNQINDWITQIFVPFLASNTQEAATVLNSGINAQNIGVLNTALSKLCIIKTHFAVNDNTTFLSNEAIQYRFDLIAEICDKLGQTIADKIATSGMLVQLTPVKVYSGLYDFSRIIPNLAPQNFNCFNYGASSTGATVKTLNELPVSPSTPTVPANAGNGTAATPLAKRKWMFVGGAVLLAWGISEIMGGMKKQKS